MSVCYEIYCVVVLVLVIKWYVPFSINSCRAIRDADEKRIFKISNRSCMRTANERPCMSSRWTRNCNFSLSLSSWFRQKEFSAPFCSGQNVQHTSFRSLTHYLFIYLVDDSVSEQLKGKSFDKVGNFFYQCVRRRCPRKLLVRLFTQIFVGFVHYWRLNQSNCGVNAFSLTQSKYRFFCLD